MKRVNGIAKNNYEEIRREIADIYQENYGSYGYRRVTAELHSRGYNINHKLVLRLMREDDLLCNKRAKSVKEKKEPFETYSQKFGKKCDDLVKRNFKADAFGQVWVTDMTQIKTKDLKVYLTIIADLYNGEIVGYSIDEEPKLRTILEAVRFAHYKHPDVKPILHSDRGWFYCADYYIELLEKYGYTRSMSETGSCLDNAAAESFFAQLKTELIYPGEFSDIRELARELHKYIKYYNTKRLKKSLGYMSPEQYRKSLS